MYLMMQRKPKWLTSLNMEMITIFFRKESTHSFGKKNNRFLVKQEKVLNWVGVWGMWGGGGECQDGGVWKLFPFKALFCVKGTLQFIWRLLVGVLCSCSRNDWVVITLELNRGRKRWLQCERKGDNRQGKESLLAIPRALRSMLVWPVSWNEDLRESSPGLEVCGHSTCTEMLWVPTAKNSPHWVK